MPQIICIALQINRKRNEKKCESKRKTNIKLVSVITFQRKSWLQVQWLTIRNQSTFVVFKFCPFIMLEWKLLMLLLPHGHNYSIQLFSLNIFSNISNFSDTEIPPSVYGYSGKMLKTHFFSAWNRENVPGFRPMQETTSIVIVTATTVKCKRFFSLANIGGRKLICFWLERRINRLWLVAFVGQHQHQCNVMLLIKKEKSENTKRAHFYGQAAISFNFFFLTWKRHGMEKRKDISFFFRQKKSTDTHIHTYVYLKYSK